VQERTRKRPRSKSEYSTSVRKRTRIDRKFASYSSEDQDIISKAASILQVPSGDVPVAIGNLSSPFLPSGDSSYLLTQQPEQPLQNTSTTFWNSVPEQSIQPSAGGFERLPSNDLALITNMYGPASLCLPDKYFGFARSPLQWAECFASFASLAPFRPTSTNQPSLSKWLFLTKSVNANFLANEYLYSLEKSENGACTSEKPFIPTGTNPYASQPYFDDPQTHLQRPVAEEQVSRSIPEMKLTEC
jgi:hypothetical protein